MSSKPDFEKQMKRVQKIVEELENSELSLEKNLALYKEGKKLAKSCQEELEKAKNEIFIIENDDMEKFDPEAIKDKYFPEEIEEPLNEDEENA